MNTLSVFVSVFPQHINQALILQNIFSETHNFQNVHNIQWIRNSLFTIAVDSYKSMRF